MSFVNYIKLREVSKKDLENIDLKRDLHFNNIFGNKLRIVIPLDQDDNINKLISKLEELGYEVDYEDLINKKQAYKKIKTQQGEKLRPEKIGKILQSSNQKELLDWWQKNGDNLKNNKTGSSIIISRSPIDVLRMSDHDGISSCHSPDGQFYKCARQEAKTGGAIAYVVKNSDLSKINLQDEEIFEDPDRNVDGIVPLERLRLRRLTNGDLDLLVPEIRTYGIKNVGFLNAIKNWAKNSQEKIINQIDPVEGYKSFKLKGGSYQDSDAGNVWSKFFDVEISGAKRSQDEDEENEDDFTSVYERAERSLQQHSTRWKHIDVNLDSEENYLYYSGYGSFSISKKLFTEQIGKWNSTNYKIIKRIVEDALDISGLEDLEIEDQGTEYSFRFMFNETDRYYDELTNFEHFLDYADDVDKNFEENINKVKKALLDEGYIKDLTERVEFKNFNIEVDEEDFTISSKEAEKIGYLKDYVTKRNYINNNGKKVYITQWNKDFANLINQYKVLPFKVSTSNFNLFFTNQMGGIYDKDSFFQEEGMAKLTGWVYFSLNVSLDIDLYKNSEVIKRIKNLDNNWDFYIKKLAQLFEIYIRNKQATDPVQAYYKDLIVNQKQLAQKPIFKKPQKQLGLNFKEWLSTY